MRVLYQEWNTGKETQYSISRDMEQYEETVKRAGADGTVPWYESPTEASVSDDSVFADMLEEGTVFLHPDEMEHVQFE